MKDEDEELKTFFRSLGYEPKPYQIEIMKRIRNSGVVPRHPLRQAGKSKSKEFRNGKAKP